MVLDVVPFSESEMAIQTENNEPMLIAPLVEREIEVSHWGNVRVEEDVTLSHVGARFDTSCFPLPAKKSCDLTLLLSS